jgi:hypothetical protein
MNSEFSGAVIPNILYWFGDAATVAIVLVSEPVARQHGDQAVSYALSADKNFCNLNPRETQNAPTKILGGPHMKGV